MTLAGMGLLDLFSGGGWYMVPWLVRSWGQWGQDHQSLFQVKGMGAKWFGQLRERVSRRSFTGLFIPLGTQVCGGLVNLEVGLPCYFSSWGCGCAVIQLAWEWGCLG